MHSYLSSMLLAVAAYTPEHIDAYTQRVEREGLSEHGFTRLTATIGILLAHGYLPDYRNRFLRMMNLCCSEIPTAKARNGNRVGNDFGIREIVHCLLEIEEAHLFPEDQTLRWRSALTLLRPQEVYSCIPEPGDPVAHNWAIFAAASEQLRIHANLGGSPDFVERQIAGQLRFFDTNGMYRDPGQPLVYDFVTRLLSAAALFFGYNGPSRPTLEAHLLRAAEPTLLLQSTTGEIPFGGRSNQFLHNETFYAALCEFYAHLFQQRGDTATATRFRDAAARAMESLDHWTLLSGVPHVKNRFPVASMIGCEPYAYFDKYMVTLGSWAYLAHRFSNAVPPPEPESSPSVPSLFLPSSDFHMVCARAGNYTAQFDLNTNEHYDANGLGRLHHRYAPPPLSLSVPCPIAPSNYKLSLPNPTPLAIFPGWRFDDAWLYAYDALYTLVEHQTTASDVRLRFLVRRPDAEPLTWLCTLSPEGLDMTLTGTGELALTLPAFAFDGHDETDITLTPTTLSVGYNRWRSLSETNGTLVDTGLLYANRNGHYRRIEARASDLLHVHIHMDCP